MLSMSSGFRLEMPSPPSKPPHMPAEPIVELSIGTPSTTISGWLSPVSDETPRITMRVEEPGPPAVGLICRPATLPCSRLPKLVSVPVTRSCALTWLMA